MNTPIWNLLGLMGLLAAAACDYPGPGAQSEIVELAAGSAQQAHLMVQWANDGASSSAAIISLLHDAPRACLRLREEARLTINGWEVAVPARGRALGVGCLGTEIEASPFVSHLDERVTVELRDDTGVAVFEASNTLGPRSLSVVTPADGIVRPDDTVVFRWSHRWDRLLNVELLAAGTPDPFPLQSQDDDLLTFVLTPLTGFPGITTFRVQATVVPVTTTCAFASCSLDMSDKRTAPSNLEVAP